MTAPNIDPRLIAFFLPQYHPIPENDEWWGKGFTEWTNVTKAKPKFPGHYQPHLPADLGYYDLRLNETLQAQADMAREYGIHGFCYYHYWFNGKRLLERPVNDMLASGKPDMPFCLCWANENWTRIWDGGASNVLMQQHYNEESDREHMRWLANVFSDSRYIKVDGKPLFLVYRAAAIPDPTATTSIWRDEARKIGIGEIMFCRVESQSDELGDPRDIGFDAAIEFQPRWSIVPPSLPTRLIRRNKLFQRTLLSNRIINYRSLVKGALNRKTPSYPRYPGVTPAWDNSARRKYAAHMLVGSTPDLYEQWLREVVRRERSSDRQEHLVFVNAWNEWAEGCHLEPDKKWGRAYLEATRRAIK